MKWFQCPFCRNQGHPSSILSQWGHVIPAVECSCGAIGFRVGKRSGSGTMWYGDVSENPPSARCIVVPDKSLKEEGDE